MNSLNLRFHEKFVLRAPLLNFSSSITSVDELRTFFSTSLDFQEAIYISSPLLFERAVLWANGEAKYEKDKIKIAYTLFRYLSRARSRCTPYGLFASISTGRWGQKNAIQITNNITSETRFDSGIISFLIDLFSQNALIKNSLKYYPNNTIYSLGNQLRFIKYNRVNSMRFYNISSVQKSPSLNKILQSAKNGITIDSLVELLSDRAITKEQAQSFVMDIINCRLLVSELEQNATGDDPINQLISILRASIKNRAEDIIEQRSNVIISANDTLKEVTVGKFFMCKKIVSDLKAVGISVSEKNLLQVNSYRSTFVSEIDNKIKEALLDAVGFLQKISIPQYNNDLENFKKRFIERYGNQEVGLLSVLDTETGIGYPSNDVTGNNKLVDDISLPMDYPLTQLQWNIKEDWLLGVLSETLFNKKYSIDFSALELDFNMNHRCNMNFTAALMFKVIDAVNNKVELKFVGNNACSLIGRFAHWDKNIYEIIKDISLYEKQFIGNDTIIAEVAHLAQDRDGNITRRPNFRDYEIPYISRSGIESSKQIMLDDLFISVKNDRILLRSRRLDKEILPSLSTAHNFQKSSLPIYRFLCELHLQNINSFTLAFNWGALSRKFKFLPRAEYKNVILSPASWNLSYADYETLLKSSLSSNFMEVIETWKKKWGIPNLVSLIDGKDGLLINFNNELSVRVFLDEIQEQKSIELREFLFDGKNSLIKDKAGKAYANEIIAFLFNPAHKLPHTPLSAKHTAYKSNQRYYSLGSEWLYYKIYCGVKTADTLLANEILQLVKYLSSKGLLERWFFIRYADPETHIRLRIFNKDRDKIFEIIKIVHEYISPLQKNGIISKILSDTYIREFERYGWHSMEISEEYFDIDSRAALSLLEFSVKNGNDEIKWHYFAGSVNDLLTSFNYSLEEKINLTGHLKTCYLNEHGGSKELKLQLDEKYRALKPMIENVLNKIGETPISPVIKLLDFKREQTSQIVAELIGLKQKNLLTVPTNDMISSYLHMSANRIFMAKQRTYEMVIYDMLYRFYKSQLAKNKFALNGAKTTN